ncbi:MAG: hypothetical protein IJ460_04390 [Clostridia bacterium]|nr:hypothetical protein [Clostridia bacterium]
MKITHIANIRGGQDGAVFGDWLFRMNTDGTCTVYNFNDLDDKDISKITDIDPVSAFVLDRADEIVPHSNAVMFGNEYYSAEDEFPLLYSNIYNNYANAEDKLTGVCCVYRLQREGKDFHTTLVQLIEIGFTDNTEYWKSFETINDVRPYGNFAIDTDKSIYYAFVMRDFYNTTRYFAFDLPKVSDGEKDEKLNVRKVTLGISDIRKHFDCEYHHFIQGACCHQGKIYSTEGFTDSEENPPAIRIINPDSGLHEKCIMLGNFGINEEAEFIDFRGDTCYYSDIDGRLYVIEF